MARWRVNLLGEFSLIAPDGQRVNLPGRKHQALIAYVLLASGKSVNREKILGLLWGSRSDDQARASLRGVLSEIRRSMQKYATPPIEADRTRIYLDQTRIESDVAELLDAGQSSSVAAVAKAVNLYGGELIESIHLNEQQFEEWRQVEQQNIRASYRKLLVVCLQNLEQDLRDDDLEKITNQLLDLDGADEDAHRALMKFYYRQGKTSLALNQFELCKSRLRAQYGSEVSDETMSLLASIREPAEQAPLERALPQKVAEVDSKRTMDAIPEIALAILPVSVAKSDQIGSEFGELISEEIIGAAAKFKWFRVIPRSETFKESISSLGSAEVGQITGAKYVMHGRIRELGGTHRLSIELVDCINNRTSWNERFELTNEALVYPEDIVAQVVGQLDVKVRASEISQTYRLNRQDLSAYQCSLLALSNMYDLSFEAYQDSESLFAKAVKMNPNNSWFYSVWALWKTFCLGQNWVPNPEQEFEHAVDLAHQAIKRDPDDALALVILGHLESFWGCNLEQGRKLIDYSLKMNPYSSFAWMLSSATYSYCGEPVEALRRLEKSKLLCPVEPYFEFLFDTANCVAHLFNHDPERAIEWGYKTVRENADFSNGYKHLLVALGHLNKPAEFEHYLELLTKIEPDFNAEKWLASYPFARESDRKFYHDGLLPTMQRTSE